MIIRRKCLVYIGITFRGEYSSHPLKKKRSRVTKRCRGGSLSREYLLRLIHFSPLGQFSFLLPSLPFFSFFFLNCPGPLDRPAESLCRPRGKFFFHMLRGWNLCDRDPRAIGGASAWRTEMNRGGRLPGTLQICDQKTHRERASLFSPLFSTRLDSIRPTPLVILASLARIFPPDSSSLFFFPFSGNNAPSVFDDFRTFLF